MGTCPHCEATLMSAGVSPITLYEPDGGTLKGYIYSCRSCQAVLNVGIDPFAQVDDIVRAVLESLGKH